MYFLTSPVVRYFKYFPFLFLKESGGDCGHVEMYMGSLHF